MTITETLNQASAGLLMPSESEFPFEGFHWDNVNSLSAEVLLELTGHAPDTQVEETDLDYLFRNLAVSKEWHDEIQQANVPKFQQLKQIVEDNLSEITVYRVGTIELDVYIVGKPKAKNGLAGLATKVIET
ncbi:nuclease [Leptolyngbya sp. 'hensonii']|uniref:nuclease A inhibitor family protein n=1 Tax=Leptolyngbya sp. 'hensonii' TaxID=1922337 RepID=UPI00094FA610|nr:nuclease A inhibitor family protein [Leptolyngbya sp. 'hensonii']OLP17923.1 nuclease [Leptolyngbya sp. 'hensonii']